MDNKETIVRESRYEYDKDEKLTSMTINETITNPHMTEGLDFAETKSTLTDIALAVTGLGLCLTAVASIFKHR